jgi:hypothetical protein
LKFIVFPGSVLDPRIDDTERLAFPIENIGEGLSVQVFVLLTTTAPSTVPDAFLTVTVAPAVPLPERAIDREDSLQESVILDTRVMTGAT